MTPNENILSVIPGASEHQRLVIVHRSMDSRDSVQLFRPEQMGESPAEVLVPLATRPFCEQVQAIRDQPIVLRQESFSPAVGWFTQSEMELTMEQWAAMRTTMLPAESSPQTTGASSRFGRTRIGGTRFGKTQGRNHSVRSGAVVVRPRVMSVDGEVIALSIASEDAVPA